MLRIRTLSRPGETLLVPEGRLTGPWVDELARCRTRLRDENHAGLIRVELEGVTFVSRAAGKDMHEHGAQFIADDCMTKAVVEEIVGHE